MHHEKCDIVIIGAGLTGLTLAYLLRNEGHAIKLIEARNRIGGRILSSHSPTFASIELGATWLGAKHKALNKLIEEIGLEVFEQELGSTAIYEPMSINPPQIVQLPPNQEPSYRISGGTLRLIDRLVDYLDTDCIFLQQPVQAISSQNSLVTTTLEYEFESDLVISTLPPNLFYQTIQVTPALPASFHSIAGKTHTWMGASIKVGLTYKQPFWREGNLSGTIFSNVGPIPEMYDHSNVANNLYALKGFFNGNYHSISRDERLEMVMRQLEKYYGSVVRDFLTYEEKVWAHDKHTYLPYQEEVLPHQYNGDEVYQDAFLGGRLFIGGTETATIHPGYMEGAVQSALSLRQRIKAFYNL